MTVTQVLGAKVQPTFADPAEWNNTRTYAPLTIVLHEGNSFTSKQYVPVGIDISNTDFWAETGNYNAQVEAYRKETYRAQESADKAIDSFGKYSYVDITYIGCKPNDKQFKNAAIINAALETGLNLMVPDGIFYIEEPVNITKNSSIKCEGTLKANDSFSYDYMVCIGYDITTTPSIDTCVLRQHDIIKVDGNRLNVTGVKLRYCYQCQITVDATDCLFSALSINPDNLISPCAENVFNVFFKNSVQAENGVYNKGHDNFFETVLGYNTVCAFNNDSDSSSGDIGLIHVWSTTMDYAENSAVFKTKANSNNSWNINTVKQDTINYGIIGNGISNIHIDSYWQIANSSVTQNKGYLLKVVSSTTNLDIDYYFNSDANVANWLSDSDLTLAQSPRINIKSPILPMTTELSAKPETLPNGKHLIKAISKETNYPIDSNGSWFTLEIDYVKPYRIYKLRSYRSDFPMEYFGWQTQDNKIYWFLMTDEELTIDGSAVNIRLLEKGNYTLTAMSTETGCPIDMTSSYSILSITSNGLYNKYDLTVCDPNNIRVFSGYKPKNTNLIYWKELS